MRNGSSAAWRPSKDIRDYQMVAGERLPTGSEERVFYNAIYTAMNRKKEMFKLRGGKWELIEKPSSLRGKLLGRRTNSPDT